MNSNYLAVMSFVLMYSAYALLNGVAADVSNLCTFGCDAYVHLPATQREKDGFSCKERDFPWLR